MKLDYLLSFLVIQWTVERRSVEIMEINEIVDDQEHFELVRPDFTVPQKEINREIEKPKENIIISEILSDENPDFIDEPILSIFSYHSREKVKLPSPPPRPEFAEPNVPVKNCACAV